MAWTQADVDKLKRAIAQGASSVRFADRSVEYRDLREMRETLAMMESEVGAAAGRKRRRQIRFATSSGLC